MKKIISTLLIIIGLMVFFYPKISIWYYEYQQKKIMNQMQFVHEDKEKEDRKEDIKNKEVRYVIKIDKINLCQPILEGATNENLKISICTIKDNIKPGDIGNYALAGHRSHNYGRNFNRLDEIVIGDEIRIYKDLKEYIYIVNQKFIVKPDEVGVLKDDKEEREITLLTCHPIINPNSRLVIKGKLK